jgi:hypothetical protein
MIPNVDTDRDPDPDAGFEGPSRVTAKSHLTHGGIGE